MKKITIEKIMVAWVLCITACLYVVLYGVKKRVDSTRVNIGKHVLVDGDTLIRTAISEENYVLSNNSVIDQELALKFLVKNNIAHDPIK
jgi:hypothetical protein